MISLLFLVMLYSNPVHWEHGLATWYDCEANHNGFYAAHKTIPKGSLVKVVSKVDGSSVVVKINDRGPYGKGRIIDLSVKAAKKLNMIRAGVIPVKIRVIKEGRR